MGALHGLRVKSPYQLLKIEDIKIENKPNEHGYLYLNCLIDDSINFKSTINASTDDNISVYQQIEVENSDNNKSSEENSGNINEVNETNSKKLFDGIINSIKTTNIDGVYYLEIEALTSSIELDIKEKSRSFQNINMTYDELITEILKEYSVHNFTQCIANGEKIGKPLFQYKESDWNFLKRLANELSSEIYCDIIQSYNLFYFGRSSNASYEIEDMKYYKTYKDLQRFRDAGGYSAGDTDTDYFYYEIEKRDKYEIGDDIYFKNKQLYVNQYSAYALKDEVIYKYRLCRKNGVWQTKMFNSLLKGASLEGKVLATEGEKVKLHLTIDDNQSEDEASWFPYAPPTGNMMYSMPVAGTSARLYFPNEIGEEPIVTGCVRNNGSNCKKTSDTTKRYLGTEHGSEIEMIPDAINIKGGSSEPLSIKFEDNIGVTLTSHKKLTLNADDDIIIKTPKSVKINAQSQILVAKTNTQSGFAIESEFHFLGENVMKNGSDTEAFAPFDDEPKEGKKPDPPQPEEEESGFDWGKLLINVVAAVAVVVVVAAVVAAVVFTAGTALPAVAGAMAAVGTSAGAAAEAAFTTGVIMGTLGVANKAVSDKNNGKVSDIGDYIEIGAKDSFAGAVCGAIFAPFGAMLGETTGLLGEIPTALQSAQTLLKTMVMGGTFNVTYDYLRDGLDGKIPTSGEVWNAYKYGALFSGVFHVGAAGVSEASPFIKNATSKISAEMSENIRIAKIALKNMENGPKSVTLGSNMGNVADDVGRFAEEFKKVKNEIKSGTEATSEVKPMSWNEFQADNAGDFDNSEMSKAWEEYKRENYPNEGEHYIQRPYIRQSTLDAVDTNTIFNSKGQAWDNNAMKWVEGTPDLGHIPGHEFWYERNIAEEKGWTQQEFNEYMNNPEFYQWEDASSNRSHKYEDKHE